MSCILPGLILALLVYGYIKRIDVYSAFISGAAEALPMIVKILPAMAAMMTALSIFRQSGAMDGLTAILSPLCEAAGMPGELAPLFILRPFSGGAAMALLQDVFTAYGPDSRLGCAASVMLGSTETIFYTVSLYLGSVGVTNSRHSVPAALTAAVIGAAAALVLT